ncbi:MAG TPA: hemolysin family protein [Candidatus Kapabacteria bacterium]|nr:hemolysin family protein [Candidatus Kapabacteria bacterium]
MLPLSLEIVLVIFSLIVFGIFSMIETSILTVRRSVVKKLLEDADEKPKVRRHAKAILDIKSQPEEFLAFVQSGTIVSAILAATFASFIGLEEIADLITSISIFNTTTAHAIALVLTIMILAPLLLTLGGLIPKSIALHQNIRFSLAFAPFVRKALKVVKPITHFPVVLANVALKPFKDQASFAESRVSEDEFLVMLEEGRRTGVIDKTENELIENIFDFKEKTVREVMIPRTKIAALAMDTPREELIHKIISEGYTRLPVFQDTLDTIVGVIYSKDVLALIEHPDLIALYDILRPVTFVPETKLISELLRDFQHKKLHLAIVIDEFGGTAGILTLEDIIEEIVGEINDEYDEEPAEVINDALNKSMTLSATLSVSDANEHIEKAFADFQIPDSDEYESFGGYVTKLAGHIPEENESVSSDGMLFTVISRTPRELLEVRIEDRRSDEPEQEG